MRHYRGEVGPEDLPERDKPEAAGHEKMPAEFDKKIQKIIDYFRVIKRERTSPCDVGLNVNFIVGEKTAYLHFNLDNYDKDEMIRMLEEGKLYEEVMLLHRLAHLPYALCYLMKVSTFGNFFRMVDRVVLLLEWCFNPFNKAKYKDLDQVRGIWEIKKLPSRHYKRIEDGIRWMELIKSGIPPDQIILDDDKEN